MVLSFIIEQSVVLTDGLGETSSVSRPLQSDKSEFSEWILLDGVSDSPHSRYHYTLKQF